DNTIVIYTVDNGGCTPDWAENGPLAGGKYHLLEGGTRTPTLIRLPLTLSFGGAIQTLLLLKSVLMRMETQAPRSRLTTRFRCAKSIQTWCPHTNC
ncbi:MAG: hypothetical protein ACPGR8_12915, partial [Limisphaerales bacterium]